MEGNADPGAAVQAQVAPSKQSGKTWAGGVLAAAGLAILVAVVVLPLVWGSEPRIGVPYEVAVLQFGPLSVSTDVFFAQLLLLVVGVALFAAYFMALYARAWRTG